MSRLLDKVAIVTGAGSGIGRATAELFATEGARVVVSDVNRAAAEQVAEAVHAAGGTALPVDCNIADEDAIKRMIEAAISRFGRIDILHNNAAATDAQTVRDDGDIISMDPALWDRVMAINLRGPMLCCKHVLPGMLAQGGGTIIMTGAVKSNQGDMAQSAYGASKAALVNLTRNIAAQYGKRNVRANLLSVALVLSPALRASFPAPFRELMESHHLTPFIGEPKDVAAAALFLASDDSRYVTGHELFVDGGFGSHSPALVDLQRFFAGAD